MVNNQIQLPRYVSQQVCHKPQQVFGLAADLRSGGVCTQCGQSATCILQAAAAAEAAAAAATVSNRSVDRPSKCSASMPTFAVAASARSAAKVLRASCRPRGGGGDSTAQRSTAQHVIMPQRQMITTVVPVRLVLTTIDTNLTGSHAGNATAVARHKVQAAATHHLRTSVIV